LQERFLGISTIQFRRLATTTAINGEIFLRLIDCQDVTFHVSHQKLMETTKATMINLNIIKEAFKKTMEGSLVLEPQQAVIMLLMRKILLDCWISSIFHIKQ